MTHQTDACDCGAVAHFGSDPCPTVIEEFEQQHPEAMAKARADASEEQRTTYRDAWHSAKDRVRKARSERDRARDVAVQLENDNRRLEDRAKEAKEQARVATVHAYRLQQQTPDAAQRTLDHVRKATSWGDLWVQLGFYYGLKPEECGAEARARRLSEVRRAEQRAERAEQQLANVRRIPRLPHHSQQDGELGRAYTRGWQSVVTCIDEALAGHPVDPTATAYPEDAALDGAQQPGPDAEGLPCRHGCRAAADELAQQTQQDGHTGGR